MDPDMDPDTLLSELLDAARAITSGDYEDRQELVSLADGVARDIQTLDTWIFGNGALPERWAEAPNRAARS